MPSFSGPWSRDLATLKKSISSIPSDHKSAFTSASNKALDIFCDEEALHVWEADSEIDSMLQLISVLAKLCDLGVRESKESAKGMKGGIVIVAEEERSKGHFGRLCELVKYITGETGSKHLEGTVCSFAGASIVVVRGWNYRPSSGEPDNHQGEAVIKRVGKALDRTLSASESEKIVWHHGAVIEPLLSFINTTTPTLRNKIKGISVTNSLHLATGVKPSAAGRSNTLPDLERLQKYAKDLGGVPVLFLDSGTLSITSSYLATYVYFFAYYIHTFLPSSLTRPHLHAAQDELVTFAFRLRGASEKRYKSDVVSVVKKHLNSRSKTWARQCIDPRSYEKEKCQAAGKENAVHHACQIADAPFSSSKVYSTSSDGVPGFARLAVGPASPVAAAKEVFIAAPVHISFNTARLRASHPSNFHVLLPKPDVTQENITNRIQGLMMGVLERVRQERGNPSFSSNEKQMWKDVVKACSWALEGCEDKMPAKIAEKVKYVQDKLTKGTWGYVVGAPGDETKAVPKAAPAPGVSEAANANAAALAAYPRAGAGMQNAYAQGYGQQQLPMGTTYGQGQQVTQGMMNLPAPAPQQYQPVQPQPVQPQPYAQGQQGNQLGTGPPGQYVAPMNGYGQGQASGYGPVLPPPQGFGYAQQISSERPPAPKHGYA